MRHIGLFGGTFNPIHTGHLLAAEAVLKQLKLDEIHFLPAAYSPFKTRPKLSDHHRIAMLKRAIEGYPRFKIDTRELSRSGPSYTIDTLVEIAESSPQSQLYLLIGMDAWGSFERWHQWQELIKLCHLVVVTRPGYTPDPLSDYWQDKCPTDINTLKDSHSGKLVFITVPASNTASSDVRHHITLGQSTNNDLPFAVQKYIEEHRLYR